MMTPIKIGYMRYPVINWAIFNYKMIIIPGYPSPSGATVRMFFNDSV